MEIYRYEPQTVTFRTRVGSTLTDADTTPTALITGSNPTYTRVPTVTKVSVGTYAVPLLYSDTTIERTLSLSFSYTLGGVNETQIVPLSVSTAYSTVDEILAIAPSGTSELQARQAGLFAKTIINGYTAQDFTNGYQEIWQDGTDKDFIVLKQPIISIDKIYEDDLLIYDSNVVGDIGITLSPTGYGIKISSVEDIILDPNRNFNSGTFSSSRHYKFTGQFGWSYVPDDVHQAHLLLCDDWFCGESKWRKRYIDEMSSADWTVKFNSQAFSGTGNFYVDSLLDPYIWNTMVVF